MSLAITAFLFLIPIGTLIATALLGMVDSDDAPEAMTGDDAPEAMTGDDYPKASEAADR